ncbi:Putative HMP/thiamine import ATP-binding protein YkoD [bacterium HR26]|nr:Putative HMP/thiamine import ATP-binding protein YkoD [bacterium HR26]
MIRIEQLIYRYPHQSRDALSSVCWQVEEGEFVLLAGASGSGKTTLLRCLNGLVPHFHGGSFGGRVLVAGLDTRVHSTARLSRLVGFVAQDPEAQGLLDCVADEIAFGLENLGYDERAIRVRVEEALDLLGIASLRNRRLATLSGGERQRVALAAALAARPHILALDEPTSQLDPWAAESILDVLRRLVDDLGLTIVLAEQRLERVLGLCSRVTLLSPDGRLERDGPPEEIASELPWPPPLIRLGLALGSRPVPLTVKQARELVHNRGLVLSPGEPVRSAGRPADPPAVELERVWVRAGERWALEDVSLAVYPGLVTILMGRNGAGKTTLLRQIVGLQKPDRGRVVVLGREIIHLSRAELARAVGYVPQHPSSMLFSESVREELVVTLRARGHQEDELEWTLQRLGLAEHAARHPYDLSGGERQRAALAAVLVGRPSILLLDEPTRGLDPERKADLGRLLRRVAADGCAVVVATHDVEFAAGWADRIALLAEGRVIAEGAPAEVLAGTLAYSTQINRVFGGPYLTVEDVLAAVGHAPVPPASAEVG